MYGVADALLGHLALLLHFASLPAEGVLAREIALLHFTVNPFPNEGLVVSILLRVGRCLGPVCDRRSYRLNYDERRNVIAIVVLPKEHTLHCEIDDFAVLAILHLVEHE